MARQSGPWLSLDDISELSRIVLTTPWAPSDIPLIGLVANSITHSHSVWHFHALAEASSDQLATLTALILLHEQEPVLPFALMPSRPPTGYLLKSGAIRRGRGFFLAPWAEQEVKRLAACLTSDHADYLHLLSAALSQRAVPGLTRPRPGFMFTDHLASSRVVPPPPKIPVDTTAIPRARHSIDPYQAVAHDYHYNRYMLLLSDEELARRTEDIISNIHIIDENGLVSIDRDDPHLWYWSSRLTELQVEMSLRHGPYPAGWDKKLIDLRNAAPSLLGATGLSAPSLQQFLTSPLEPPFLVKYGRREFLQEALRLGQVRVFPANTYQDPSLNTAIQDDELSADLFLDPSIPFNEAPPGTILFPPGRRRVTWSASSNYYVYCMSEQFNTRLLLDFEADACLVIRDPKAFLRRFQSAAANVLPGWKALMRSVEYYDPLQVQPREVDVLTSKHFRYAYQHEVRIACLPPHINTNLYPVDLELGTLSDIAELVSPATTRTGK